MMNMQVRHNTLTKTALQLFVGDHIVDVSKYDESIVFKTYTGLVGLVERNFLGDWDVWINEELIYEIEDEIFTVMEHEGDKENLLEFYERIKLLEQYQYKDKSKIFLEIVKRAVENLILNSSLPVEGEVQIGVEQVIYKNKKKIKINLN